MNIEKFLGIATKNDAEKGFYAGSFRRGFAAMIDATITLFIRVLVAQVLGVLFINSAIQNFLTEFKDKFGTEFVKNNADHIDFILHHRIFVIVLLFYTTVIFVGALYHALFNSSKWQATIGKRVVKIAMEKKDGSPLGFGLALTHYFLSVLPFVFIMYLIAYKVTNNLTFYQTVTASFFNIFFGVVFLLWTQIQSLTRRKTTAYDLICKTILVNKKTTAKFPWSKEKISNFL